MMKSLGGGERKGGWSVVRIRCLSIGRIVVIKLIKVSVIILHSVGSILIPMVTILWCSGDHPSILQLTTLGQVGRGEERALGTWRGHTWHCFTWFITWQNLLLQSLPLDSRVLLALQVMMSVSCTLVMTYTSSLIMGVHALLGEGIMMMIVELGIMLSGWSQGRRSNRSDGCSRGERVGLGEHVVVMVITSGSSRLEERGGAAHIRPETL